MGGGVQVAQSGRLWPLGIGLERMGKRLEREEKKSWTLACEARGGSHADSTQLTGVKAPHQPKLRAVLPWDES